MAIISVVTRERCTIPVVMGTNQWGSILALASIASIQPQGTVPAYGAAFLAAAGDKAFLAMPPTTAHACGLRISKRGQNVPFVVLNTSIAWGMATITNANESRRRVVTPDQLVIAAPVGALRTDQAMVQQFDSSMISGAYAAFADGTTNTTVFPAVMMDQASSVAAYPYSGISQLNLQSLINVLPNSIQLSTGLNLPDFLAPGILGNAAYAAAVQAGGYNILTMLCASVARTFVISVADAEFSLTGSALDTPYLCYTPYAPTTGNIIADSTALGTQAASSLIIGGVSAGGASLSSYGVGAISLPYLQRVNNAFLTANAELTRTWSTSAGGLYDGNYLCEITASTQQTVSNVALFPPSIGAGTPGPY